MLFELMNGDGDMITALLLLNGMVLYSIFGPFTQKRSGGLLKARHSFLCKRSLKTLNLKASLSDRGTPLDHHNSCLMQLIIPHFSTNFTARTEILQEPSCSRCFTQDESASSFWETSKPENRLVSEVVKLFFPLALFLASHSLFDLISGLIRLEVVSSL